MLRAGQGPKLLLLHGFDTIAPDAPFLGYLARQYEVLAPSCPGFGGSPRPDEVSHVYDLVHLYLELLDRARRHGERHRILVRRLACRRDRRRVVPQDREARAGRRARPQDQRARNARHPRHLQHAPARGDEAALARSGAPCARLQRHGGRGARAPRAQSRGALPLWLASLHVQPAPWPLARAHFRADAGAVGRSRRHRRAVLWQGVTARSFPARALPAIAEAGHHPEIEQPRAFTQAVLDFLER